MKAFIVEITLLSFFFVFSLFFFFFALFLSICRYFRRQQRGLKWYVLTLRGMLVDMVGATTREAPWVSQCFCQILGQWASQFGLVIGFRQVGIASWVIGFWFGFGMYRVMGNLGDISVNGLFINKWTLFYMFGPDEFRSLQLPPFTPCRVTRREKRLQ